MKTADSLALRHDGRRLRILDQTLLPHREEWLEVPDPDAMVLHIRRLAVRGAPLIGVAAALSLATFAQDGAGPAELRLAAAHLRRARPTAVNLMWAMDRMGAILDGGRCKDDVVMAELIAEAEAIFVEDVALCEAMARQGLGLFGEGEAVLTHCNSGGLATAGIGTALGLIRRGFEAGRVTHVFVDETRPLLQGARLTAWELARLGIPHTLLTDSMAAILLREGRVQRVLLGADRVAANGDFANKVGTYGLAVQCRHHGVPFHPVAPWSTVDLACPGGDAIPIEQRDPAEVRGTWAAAGTPAFNPSFDVTPAHLVTSLVTDRGVFTAAELASGILSRPRLRPTP
ncbi:S-methyl-5-thioribose-1-phosphate isomerase [Mesoterricola silvestris]|uniref:Methylthioribose-1-phosphate isomerase n=1 Tax=Mesoterricola silvestris TaxID=2927979 RepID=A0AA48GIT5_9BACT|nr:S-methyl-5-thioribose-1-phosphate isomerase [Mesoterricola silvestris]BDU71844.1 methylthioribose-1-phosphate isomerase [Mesoterricola silvestris]